MKWGGASAGRFALAYFGAGETDLRQQEDIGELEDGSEKYNRKKVEYDAAIANIMEDLLKPKDLWYNLLPRATSPGGFGWGGSQIVRLSMVGPAS